MSVNRFIFIIFICTLLLLSIGSYAQKKVEVNATYTYYAPENITLEAARSTALERAKIKAIAEKFGTVVSQSNTTRIENSNGESQIDFLSIGGSEVRGEWIETLKEPQYQISYEQGMLVVTVSVSGVIREIVYASIDIDARILRNGTERKFESENFLSGDDLYLIFKSPTSGYLAVYLVDALNNTYCLLPYRGQKEGIYTIESNREYLLFSSKAVSGAEAAYVDEYVMTSEDNIERNHIYIIFSPNKFSKAADANSNDGLPRELSFGAFQRWLSKCRTHDTRMQVIKKEITIKNTQQ